MEKERNETIKKTEKQKMGAQCGKGSEDIRKSKKCLINVYSLDFFIMTKKLIWHS
jgi:hypothetical protein